MNVWIETERAKIHFETFDLPGWISANQRMDGVTMKDE